MNIIEIDFGNDGFKIKAELSKDGDQWCVLVGDNIQEGVAGFGHSIGEAVYDLTVRVRNPGL
jgi:hypothetical protein